MELEFSRKDFQKNTEISNFTKIRSVSLLPCEQTDGWRTGTTNLRVVFLNFMKVTEYTKDYVPVTVHREQSMKREDQQDATIRCLLLTSVSTCFGHHYAQLQENKGSVIAFGVLF